MGAQTQRVIGIICVAEYYNLISTETFENIWFL